MKYIKWILTLISFLAIAGFIILSILPLRNIYATWNDLHLDKSFFLLYSSVLSAFFVIYPKSRCDSWLQRFLGGTALIFLPALFLVIAFHHDLFFAVIAIILVCSFMIYLCFILKRKVKYYNNKIDKILKAMLVSPLVISLFSLFLLFSRSGGPLFRFLLFSFSPFAALVISIPALINGNKISRWWIFLAYVGMLMSQWLLINFYMAIFNSFVGE